MMMMNPNPLKELQLKLGRCKTIWKTRWKDDIFRGRVVQIVKPFD